MDIICYLDIIPREIKDYIISLTENKVYDLCLINKYFDNNCKVIKIIDNSKYPDLTNTNLVKLINLTSLNLCNLNIITNEGIEKLVNLKTLNLYYNKIITNDGIKRLINLTSINLNGNKIITNDGIKR